MYDGGVRILVTGGCGFIGGNLVRHLLNETAHEVLNFDKLTYAGNRASLRDLESDSRYHFRQGDICDQAMVAAAFEEFEPEAVLHLAAESHVDRSIDGPNLFIQTNVVGTCTLLETARAYWQAASADLRGRFRFLHVSTDEVFGSLGPLDSRWVESSPYAPRSPYAASKASSDHLVRAWGQTYGLPVIITHCSNNYGPYQFPEKLIPTVILRAVRGETIPVYGRGENIRDWLFVEDHVRALVTVLERGRSGETYLIGGNAEWRNSDLVRAICGILDGQVADPAVREHASLIRFVADRPGHDFRYGLEARKVRTELGWEPRHAMEEGLRRTVTWYLENRDWWEPLLEQNPGSLKRSGRSKREPQV